ncbi:hypothetical protein [Streptomyces sp. NBC_01766]|uniref:hypothetical protein n=1 Tax=Streptomyces sp. NBC_01766 TaxID=2975936 RepID=UPI002DD9A008|nr:hypothetical protein [Streptomyces sp. NBC_01766]WSC19302.1 hypothetical protein OIE60_06210 [Streptomyces sp. NBC_01766]
MGVAVAFTACQFLFVRPNLGLGWDEAVYVSQVGSHAPAAFFSAPRARGISYLVAPVAVLTSSTVALRCYLAVLSGAGLLGALWVWRRFQPTRRLALAGVLFAGLWITQFYGPQAMPNLWVALGALACAGFFLRVVTTARSSPQDRWALLGTALCLGAVVLLRPPDGFWLALPLVLAALLVREWRRPAVFAALAAGLVAGGAEWVVESYLRYGGVVARLHTSGLVEGGISWNLAFTDQLRALSGRTLCRPCDVPWTNKGESLWWFALPLLAAGGVAVARRARRLPAVLLPTLCGVSMAVPYLLLINYAAPRFLLPAYALLSLPVAECLWWLAAGAGRPRLRPVTTGLVTLVLMGHLVGQYVVLSHTVTRNAAAHDGYARVATGLHGLGVTPPCLVTGDNAIPIGYYAGCASAATAGNNANTTVRGITGTAARRPTAVLVPVGQRPPDYARGWTPHRLPGAQQLTAYTAYVAPLPPG